MTKVGVFSFGRIQSQRCTNKMLRPFADTTLTDVVLTKLAGLPHFTFFAGYEAEFRWKCEHHGVCFVQRDAHSALIDEPIVEILSFLRGVDCEHLLLVSACLPFLEAATIERFLAECVAGGYRPAFAVLRRQNHFMRLDGSPINFDPLAKTINTKTVEPVYEFAHAMYFFNRDYFFEHGTYWDWGRVKLIELWDRKELVDIDTEEDFRWAEALWRARGHDHHR